MSFWGWKPYVSVAERRKQAEKAAAKAKKTGAAYSPIEPYRGAIAKTFWGKAWCENLERYSDYANRLPRGRTYVRNGSVIDLQITAGAVQAQVMGSSLYKVDVSVTAVADKQWQLIGASCSGSIDSLVELLQGKLSKVVMERICKPGTGLFPSPKEIQFSCSCPDWASMCKHVAAVLYGVGARLDQQPELLFKLRKVDAKDLVTQASTALPKARKSPVSKKVLDDSALADVFGIEMVTTIPVTPAKRKPRKSPATKEAKPSAKAAKKPPSKKGTMSSKAEPSKRKPATKPLKTAAPTQASATSRKKTTAKVAEARLKKGATKK